MHPTISYHLAQAHMSELRHRAQVPALARSAFRVRPDEHRHAVP